MDNIPGINVLNYERMKDAGLVSIAKIGNAFVVSVRKFSTETGAEESPQIIALDIGKLKESRENLLLQVAGVEKLISDLESL